ncbi:MAG TPA: 2-C-methyl-D-erythritol 4-phosphate cytidylyltransferase [Chitinophagaceae bacterium]|nr:2-C-methyl-D-erythritol 4-phosphate cytidylyltransferase [Chitinophagaceae bacterium]
MDMYAVIVAGGRGTRMGSQTPKQFLPLKGRTVLWHTLRAFVEAYPAIRLVLVLPAGLESRGREVLADFPASEARITTGGETRFHSVRQGLQLVPDNALVFVHDAVRCLVTADLIRRCGDMAASRGNAVPAIAPVDTVRIQTDGRNQPADRNRVRLVQTPQAFAAGPLRAAFVQPYQERFTDEATVLEATGAPIYLVEGERSNIKITTPIDLLVAEKILEEREAGFGTQQAP